MEIGTQIGNYYFGFKVAGTENKLCYHAGCVQQLIWFPQNSNLK